MQVLRISRPRMASRRIVTFVTQVEADLVVDLKPDTVAVVPRRPVHRTDYRPVPVTGAAPVPGCIGARTGAGSSGTGKPCRAQAMPRGRSFWKSDHPGVPARRGCSGHGTGMMTAETAGDASLRHVRRRTACMYGPAACCRVIHLQGLAWMPCHATIAVRPAVHQTGIFAKIRPDMPGSRTGQLISDLSVIMP